MARSTPRVSRYSALTQAGSAAGCPVCRRIGRARGLAEARPMILKPWRASGGPPGRAMRWRSPAGTYGRDRPASRRSGGAGRRRSPAARRGYRRCRPSADGAWLHHASGSTRAGAGRTAPRRCRRRCGASVGREEGEGSQRVVEVPVRVVAGEDDRLLGVHHLEHLQQVLGGCPAPRSAGC